MFCNTKQIGVKTFTEKSVLRSPELKCFFNVCLSFEEFITLNEWTDFDEISEFAHMLVISQNIFSHFSNRI